MDGIEKQITNLELRLTRSPGVANSVGLVLRSWLAFRTADAAGLSDTLADPRAFLYKAHHAVTASLRKNESDVRLFMLDIFISIELERFDHANEMLDTAMGFRTFLRTNEPFYYAVLLFLYAYLEIKQKRARSAKKHIRTLQEFIKASSPGAYYDLMQGILHLSFYEYNEAYEFLTKAYDGGCESVFMYYALFHYYRTAVHAPSGHTLIAVLRWASARRLDVSDIVGVYQDELRAAIIKDPAAGERIYESVPHPFILREICACRMMAGDYSAEAYAYYRAAENRQIYLSGLYQFLVRAAFEKRAEHINHYAMAEFLQAGPPEPRLAAYVYHLLLSDPSLADLLPAHKNEMLKLAAHSLETGWEGREANSLYYYYWTQCREMNIKSGLVDKAEEILYENLTRYEVLASSDVRFVYATEPEKKGMEIYELTPSEDGGRVVINAVSPNASGFICFSAGKKRVLDGDITVRRMVSRAEPALYRYFFNKGARDYHLLAYLANYYLHKLTESDETQVKPIEDAAKVMPVEFFAEAVSVFTEALEDKTFVKSYRMRLLVALGRLHYGEGQFAKALAYYGSVDENELDDAHIEKILQVFLQTHEWARAAGLIKRRWRFVKKEPLAAAVGQLAGKEMSAYHEAVADPAYHLLVNGHYAPELLAIALNHYRAGQAEWVNLAHALAAAGVASPRLDETLVTNSITAHEWSADAQKAFARLCKGLDLSRLPTDSPILLSRFIEYAAYEMLVNNAKPEYETLAILEDVCLTAKPSEPMLMYGLCHIYLSYGISTFNSENILAKAAEAQSQSGILFPVFRDNRSKQPCSLFIEKYQPFLYRGLPGKDVHLYYRLDDAASWHTQRMEYLRFGIYLTKLPVFYNEKLTYYFSEEMLTGSITTREASVKNEVVYIDETAPDRFFTINNAVIYEQMFRYDMVEKIINELVREVKPVRSSILI